MLRMAEKESKLAHRMDRLEERINEIYVSIIDLKANMEKILSLREQAPISSVPLRAEIARERINEMVRTPNRMPNPWAIDTAISLMDSRYFRNTVNKSYETYKPTVEALRRESDWVSAEEVRKMTGKARNTESTYLNRLFHAQVVERKRERNKMLYRLKEEKDLKKVFGIRRRY